MNQFGDLYSQYYDLLYSDKDYQSEVEYVDGLIKANNPTAITLLDMGCGTGRHAELFSDKGYMVHGIDLSADMLKIAELRRLGREDRLSFSQSNITELNLGTKFDVIVSLFHVMCYQNSNKELTKAIEVAKNHLNDNGILIFDFWYGPAVLTDPPITNIKRLENQQVHVTRIAESSIHAQTNIVEVNYDIFVTSKNMLSNVLEKKERHNVRYFFDTELELIMDSMDLTILNKFKWMSNENPNLKSWNVVWVVKK
ncbi:MAG: class I SAM-dependent methyltransferase [Sulfuricurvum sp.]|jgi:SAM-dependent methyltransferase